MRSRFFTEKSSVYWTLARILEAAEQATVDDNRRTETRIFCGGSAHVVHMHFLGGTIVDISRGGMFLELGNERPPVGTQLRLRIRLPGVEDCFLLRSEVRHHGGRVPGREHGIGLQFLEMPAEAFNTLQRFMEATVQPLAARHA
jgi:hypothetical protein